MKSGSAPATIDEYIKDAAPQAQPILKQIRALVHSAVPDATETISYRMPAFKLHKTFFYFAAFKTHIGIFPPVRGSAALLKAVAPYANDKGNLRFDMSGPIPYALIERIAISMATAIGR